MRAGYKSGEVGPGRQREAGSASARRVEVRAAPINPQVRQQPGGGEPGAR